MKDRNFFIVLLILICLAVSASGLFAADIPTFEIPQNAAAFDDNGDGIIDHWEYMNSRGGTTICLDTKGIGEVTYVLEQDAEGYKFAEAMDYNGDGLLDDFYYYNREVLIRQEIDTNYDGKIDTWVYLTEGVYIERYERDTDYDGVVDLVKRFGQ